MKQTLYKKTVTIFKEEDVGKIYMYQEGARLIPLLLKEYYEDLLFVNVLNENETYTLEDLCIKDLDQVVVLSGEQYANGF